jgi:hypothetical protein
MQTSMSCTGASVLRWAHRQEELLWVSGFILAYDGRPSYSVNVMDFLDDKVAHDARRSADAFKLGPSNARLVEWMG